MKRIQDRALKSRSLGFASLRKMLDSIGLNNSNGETGNLDELGGGENGREYSIVKTLETTSGFVARFGINVIATETVYNDNFQPFTIWFIDKCIYDVLYLDFTKKLFVFYLLLYLLFSEMESF